VRSPATPPRAPSASPSSITAGASNDHFDVSPDLQWIWRAGGNAAAPTIFVGGVRARVGF
jgi:carbohydrate-selective porin OprB